MSKLANCKTAYNVLELLKTHKHHPQDFSDTVTALTTADEWKRLVVQVASLRMLLNSKETVWPREALIKVMERVLDKQEWSRLFKREDDWKLLLRTLQPHICLSVTNKQKHPNTDLAGDGKEAYAWCVFALNFFKFSSRPHFGLLFKALIFGDIANPHIRGFMKPCENAGVDVRELSRNCVFYFDLDRLVAFNENIKQSEAVAAIPHH